VTGEEISIQLAPVNWPLSPLSGILIHVPRGLTPYRRASLWSTVAAFLLAFSGASGCGRDARSIHASGIIEMDEIDVASMVGGRVTRLFADEGDSVRAGDTLAVLGRDEVVADVRAQTAEAERAAAQAREVVTGPRTGEIRVARAALASAQAQVDWAESDLERTQKLFQSDVAPQAELDRAKTARDDARAKRDAAKDQLRLLEAGSRREQITAARQGAAAARAALLGAQSRSRELVLLAPSDGVVLLRNYEPGELVPAGLPVLTLGNPESLWVRVYVPAPDVIRIRRGSAAIIQVSGSSHRFAGRVAEIATHAEFTPRAALTEEERANIVFAIKVALAPSGGALKAGVPADAVIEAIRPSP
jgi:HlyD family secretion protein